MIHLSLMLPFNDTAMILGVYNPTSYFTLKILFMVH
jgi:hypothetical protein